MRSRIRIRVHAMTRRINKRVVGSFELQRACTVQRIRSPQPALAQVDACSLEHHQAFRHSLSALEAEN